MPRDGAMIWCDRCGIFLAAPGKKPDIGERAAGVMTETVMVCDRCAQRQGITAGAPAPAQPTTPAADPEPTTPPAPAPAPALAAAVVVDLAQAALDALPAWIKEDGAVHGRHRLSVATEEAHRTSNRVPGPTPVVRDDRETPKSDRPVRRPAKPRPSHRQTTAKPGPAPRHRLSVAEKYGAPAPAPVPAAEIIRRRRAMAEAYAEKFGTVMAPPSRRPIVTAEEISSGMRRMPVVEEGAPGSLHPDVVLDSLAAAKYLGTTANMLNTWRAKRRGPRFSKTGRQCFYRVADLDEFRAERERQKRQPSATVAPAEVPAAAPVPAPKPTRPTREQRLARFTEYLDEGLAPKEAAARAGYSNLSIARAACKAGDRTDLLERLPCVRTAPPHVQAAKQRSVERIKELEELLNAGTVPRDAVIRVGYKNVASATRQLDRMGRNDLASWVRRGRPRLQKRAA